MSRLIRIPFHSRAYGQGLSRFVRTDGNHVCPVSHTGEWPVATHGRSHGVNGKRADHPARDGVIEQTRTMEECMRTPVHTPHFTGREIKSVNTRSMNSLVRPLCDSKRLNICA